MRCVEVERWCPVVPCYVPEVQRWRREGDVATMFAGTKRVGRCYLFLWISREGGLVYFVVKTVVSHAVVISHTYYARGTCMRCAMIGLFVRIIYYAFFYGNPPCRQASSPFLVLLWYPHTTQVVDEILYIILSAHTRTRRMSFAVQVYVCIMYHAFSFATCHTGLLA